MVNIACLDAVTSEDGPGRLAFFRSLVTRGLSACREPEYNEASSPSPNPS